MRIGIIGVVLDRQYAGIHYFTKNLIKHLWLQDDSNEYFIFRENKAQEELDGVEIILKTPKWLPFIRSLQLFLFIPILARKYKLDVLIEPAHFGPFNLPKRIKRVTVIHDLTPLLFKKWHPFYSWFLQKLFLPKIIRRADLIITNSEYTKSDLVRYLKKPSNKIVAIHLGISEIFKPTYDPDVLGKYGIYKDYILYQGTLEPRKNLINLMKGYELYRHANPHSNEQLILSGREGWKAKGIIRKKYSSQYRDDIILLGYVDRADMPAIYSGARVFAYSSFYEGFGLPVLEAMACGTPIITSNSSSLPEVSDNYALYFDPMDIKQISKSILFAKQTSDDHINDQINYAKKFTWQKTAKKVIDALNGLKDE